MPLRLSPRVLLGLAAGLLLLVALILRPGGTVESASTQLTRVADKAGAAAPPAASARAAAPPRAWFAPDGESASPPAAAFPAPITVPPGDPQPIYLDPPPQGPDFPPTR